MCDAATDRKDDKQSKQTTIGSQTNSYCSSTYSDTVYGVVVLIMVYHIMRLPEQQLTHSGTDWSNTQFQSNELENFNQDEPGTFLTEAKFNRRKQLDDETFRPWKKDGNIPWYGDPAPVARVLFKVTLWL
ncbi:hypothetical protein PG999_002076 [Apiospora kogelbergensis]|uniref:Uncharacterized protein n=1 Tax=Apiospora kogelbergensis TaxID=1337665 RepID=A0AAW0R7C5_9PEZI